MKLNELKLKNVGKSNLELLIANLEDAEKMLNNADFIRPTDVQIVIIKTIEYYKNALGDEIEFDFHKDLLFSCIYKDIILLSGKIDNTKLEHILNTIIVKVWDENSDFKKKGKDVENIIKYFEFLKYSKISKIEAMDFVESLGLQARNDNIGNEETTEIDFDFFDDLFKKTFGEINKQFNDIFGGDFLK